MSIIGMFKRLISGASAEPTEQVQMQSVQKEEFSEPQSVKMGELQNAPMPSWMADGCVLKFCATFQLRTPLRVLLRDGEIYSKNDGRQPQIAREMWEGIWLPHNTQSYVELACGPDSTPEDIELFKRLDAWSSERTAASDIGPIRPDDYLPFLIAIRKIVELNEPIENRIKKLREMPISDEWKTYVERHGGIEKIIRYFFSGFIDIIPIAIREILELNDSIENRIDKLREMPVVGEWKKYLENHVGIDTVIDRFFPKFIDTIPKLSLSMRDDLSKLSLSTPNHIAAAPDKTLLNIKGIGKAKLQKIRVYCSGISNNRDSYRADRVEYMIRTCRTGIVEYVIR